MDDENKDPSNIGVVNKNTPVKVVGNHKKEMLIDLLKSKTKNEADLRFTKLIEVLSQETGIGVKTVRKILNEYYRNGQPLTPRKRKFQPTINKTINSADKCTIRRKIHSFWVRHTVPTSKNILAAINAEPKIPSLNCNSLKVVLKDLNFEYTRCGNKSVLTETEDIVLWRRKYVEDIQRYRVEGRTIYYLVETWLNVEPYSSEQLCTNKEPSGESRRLTVVHIGSANGFVKGGLLCYESKTNTSNYPDHIYGDIFYSWFRRVLPLLDEHSVIVLDTSSYYSVGNNVPSMSWKKNSILQWFESKGIVFDRPIVKCQLIEKVKEIRIVFDIYRRSVQEAINHNKAVLRLPPYHFELNPIRMAWSIPFKHVKTKDCSNCNLDDVCKILNDGADLATPEKLAAYFNYSIVEEENLWKLDFIIDNILEEAATSSHIETISLVTSSEASDSGNE
ncbi:uncharacterized protein LOC111030637 [Myzus persicae]|uniref:uncharacterized protein LOC111030637 n=1 Tax=Myzus persicae TaxID=13164 RepID=UPI000B938792|nr:uncharacterized protein LOC111030637 [Myzus persicae]